MMIENGLIIDGKVYALEKAENCDCKECSLYELCKEYENDDREVTFCEINKNFIHDTENFYCFHKKQDNEYTDN